MQIYLRLNVSPLHMCKGVAVERLHLLREGFVATNANHQETVVLLKSVSNAAAAMVHSSQKVVNARVVVSNAANAGSTNL